MELKDWLAIVAIVLSGISLGASVWTALFNRSVKLAELRSQLLSKTAELSSRHARLRLLQSEIIDLAKQHGHTINWDVSMLNKLYDQTARVHAELTESPKSHSLSHYTEQYHSVTNLGYEASELERDFKERINDFKKSSRSP